jgi:peptidoglycan/LPS O-acetylase OafA/YrhL
VPYVRALDVVRGTAIALVLLGHSGLGFAAPVGVTLFFVLSGYLITRLLNDELGASDRVSLVRFYRHRFARLAPVLILVAAIVGGVGWASGDGQAVNGALASLTYWSNWMTDADLKPMQHTWSLAVEEQFYLVWPLLLALLWRIRAPLPTILAAGIVTVVAVRFAVVLGPAGTEYRTTLRADALLIGCLLALVTVRPRTASLLPAAAGLIALSIIRWPDASQALGYTIAAACSAVVVAWAARSGLTQPFLEHLGRISYGVYLWHVPVFAVVGAGMVGIGTTLVVGELSFRIVERPLRRSLREFGRRQQPAADVIEAPQVLATKS